MTCTVDGCAAPLLARQMCSMHYQRWRSTGTVGDPVVRTDLQKLMARVDASRSTFDGSPCWEWQGHRDAGGYGVIRLGPRNRRVHRVAWELLRGPITDGLVIDHLCRNRPCCNPLHLEPVTTRENTLRSPISAPAVNAARAACIRGHAFDAANTYTDARGRRACRICNQERTRRYRARQEANR